MSQGCKESFTVNPIASTPTIRTSATAGRMARPPARLVIEAMCTSCGPICDETGNGISVALLALAHSAATEHVVILNGTTDVPEEPPTRDGTDIPRNQQRTSACDASDFQALPQAVPSHDRP